MSGRTSPPIRSRVAPDVDPAGGGIVDSQQADTSPGSGSAVPATSVPLRDRIAGAAKIIEGKFRKNSAEVEKGREMREGMSDRPQ